MADIAILHRLIARARRRLRIQSALERGTTASVLASAVALVGVYLLRSHSTSDAVGYVVLASAVAILAIACLSGALRSIPSRVITTRIDRSSGLASRITSAVAFEEELPRLEREARKLPPETIELMREAVRDGVRAAPSADIIAATPFSAPRDLRAAAAFFIAAVATAGLYWPPEHPRAPGSDAASMARAAALRLEDDVVLEDDDLDYTRALLQELAATAEADDDEALKAFTDAVQALLERAEKGELSKEQLLAELAKAEKAYFSGSAGEVEEALAALQQTGRELQRSAITRELGKALAKDDLEQARAQMKELAKQLEDAALDDKQRQQLADALQKAARAFDEREKQKDEQDRQRLTDQRKEVRQLEKKLADEKNQGERERQSRQLDKKKRELQRLERKQEQQQASPQRRRLKELHRQMQQAAEDLRRSDPTQGQQQASRRMRDMERNTGRVDADRRKIKTQKKVASQVQDLKEALRRAKRRGQRGPKDLFGRNKKNQDFERRSRGQQGSRQAWKPGQGQGQGQAAGAGQPGQGEQGDGHDPNVLGDPTPRAGEVKDEQVSGVAGREGSSVRETILSAAQKGFATQRYRQVYADYKNIVEEVMRSEKVPSGYKYYVKKYFQKIKPHSMD